MLKGANFQFSATNRGGAAMASFEKGLKNVRKAQDRVKRSNGGFMKGMNANRRIIQQVGFQVSDLGVQIAGGQSALLALTQNVPQVVQMFGAWGGILAGLITLLGTFSILLLKSGKGFADIAPMLGITRSELAHLGEVLSNIKEKMIDFANVVINNIDVLLISLALYVSFLTGRFIVASVASGKATMFFGKSLIFLRKMLLRTGIGALFIAMGYLIERLFTLREAIGSWGQTLKLVGDIARQVFMSLPAFIIGFQLKSSAAIERLKANFLGFLSSMVESSAMKINVLVGAFVGMKLSIDEIMETVKTSMVNTIIDAVNKQIGVVEKGVLGMMVLLNKLPNVNIPLSLPDFGKLDRLPDRVGTISERIKGKFKDAFSVDYAGAVSGTLSSASDNSRKLAADMSTLGDKMFGAAGDAIPAWQELKKLLAGVDGPKFDVRNLFGKGVDKDMEKLRDRLKDNVAVAKKAAGVLSTTLADTNIDFSIDRIAASISKLSGIPAPRMGHILGEVDKVRERVRLLSVPIQAEIDKLNSILASDLKAINPSEFFRSTTEIATRIQEMSIPIKAEMEKINLLHPKLKGVDISFFTGSLDAAVNKVRTTMDTVRDTMGEIHNMPSIKLPKIDTKPAKAEISKMMQFIKDLGQTVGESIKSGMKGLITGTSSLKDALSNVLDSIASKLADFAIDTLLNGIGGMLGGGAGGGGILQSFLGSVFSFDGGGFTGNGSRSGGVDGKGGFPAILHPNETVVDHTRTKRNPDHGDMSRLATGYSGNQGSAPVTMINHNHFNGVTREEVMRDVRDAQSAQEKRLAAKFPSQSDKHQFNRQRGLA